MSIVIEVLFSGLVGTLIGGILTCIYNEYAFKKRYRYDIFLKSFDEVSKELREVLLTFSRLLSYLQTEIDSSNEIKFIATSKAPTYNKENFCSLTYAFGESATHLMGIMDGRQLVFIKYRKYYNSINAELVSAMKILPDVIVEIESPTFTNNSDNIQKLQATNLRLKEVSWNLSIDMENFFNKVMYLNINKKIPPGKEKFDFKQGN